MMGIVKHPGCAMLLVSALLTGCAAKSAAPTTQQADAGMLPDAVHLIDAPATISESGNGPKDAQRQVTVVIQMEIYQLSLPFGTLSRNEEFWKRIDEQCV